MIIVCVHTNFESQIHDKIKRFEIALSLFKLFSGLCHLHVYFFFKNTDNFILLSDMIGKSWYWNWNQTPETYYSRTGKWILESWTCSCNYWYFTMEPKKQWRWKCSFTDFQKFMQTWKFEVIFTHTSSIYPTQVVKRMAAKWNSTTDQILLPELNCNI